MSDDNSADLVTSKTCLLLQGRPIVGLSSLVARTHQQAQRSNRVFTLVTRANSALTLALTKFINSTRSYWIVEHPDGAYDGLTGRRAQWQQDSFQLYAALHPAYLSNAAVDERAIWVQAEALHSYSDDPTLGIFATRVLAGAGYAPPVRFDVMEPLTAAYSPEAVTEHARRHSPQATIGIASSSEGDALIISLPTRDGVEERLEFCGPCPKDLSRALLEHCLRAALEAGARNASIGYRKLAYGRMTGPRYLRKLLPLGFAVHERAMPHTSLEQVIAEVRALGVETHILPGLGRGLGCYFDHHNTPAKDVARQYLDVLRLVLPPDDVRQIDLRQR